MGFFFFFLLGSDSKGSREPWEAVWSRFSESWDPIAVRTGPFFFFFFYIERFLGLKEPEKWMVRGFSGWTVRSGPGFKTLILFSPLVFCILSYIMRHHVLDHVRYKWMDIHRRIWSIMFLKNFRAKKKKNLNLWDEISPHTLACLL